MIWIRPYIKWKHLLCFNHVCMLFQSNLFDILTVVITIIIRYIPLHRIVTITNIGIEFITFIYLFLAITMIEHYISRIITTYWQFCVNIGDRTVVINSCFIIIFNIICMSTNGVSKLFINIEIKCEYNKQSVFM